MTSTLSPSQAPKRKDPDLVLLRALATAYQSFVELDNRLLRPSGLTQTQFDIIATLGNTPGMTMRELSARTLVTKGALTGVVDRLAARGLVERRMHPNDRRCFIVALTREGDETFSRTFAPHVARLREILAALGEGEKLVLAAKLDELTGALRGGAPPSQDDQDPSTSTIK